MIDPSELKRQVEEEVKKADSLQKLSQVKAKYLGKEGTISLALKGIKDLPQEKRKDYGSQLNALKEFVEKVVKEKEEYLKNLEIEKRLSAQWVDMSVPLEGLVGALHPITQTLMRIRDIFVSMGFSVFEGPEMELEIYNFDLLNIPKEHPARGHARHFLSKHGRVSPEDSHFPSTDKGYAFPKTTHTGYSTGQSLQKR
jgi:phenylalanyl-tRNA synthetase alpha chain